MENNKELLNPVLPSERIGSIDLLRGIAVLGILIMNIQSFSMIGAAYINPAAYGDLTGINKWIWILSHILASEKFLSIFSILFGAGVLLLSTKAIEKGRKAGPLHFRRMMWLFIFGMIHAYFIWYGDILVAYSLCGMLVYVFRNQSPKSLLFASVGFFIIPILLYTMSGISIPMWPKESYDNSLQGWLPDAGKIQEEIENMRGSWQRQMDTRVPASLMMQTFLFLLMVGWRVLSMMLLGMALFKMAVLTAQKSKAFYWKMAIIGLISGFALTIWGVYENFAANWKMDFSLFIGSLFNYAGSVGVAVGYIALIMLFGKSESGQKVKGLFASVGKMAFSNYILMSLIGMFLFYGNGLGLFGQVERWQQLLFMLGIWIIILIISPFWLKKYRFGPLEWFWRELTYWHFPEIKKK